MYRLRFGDSHPIVYPIVVTLNRRNTLIIATCVLILVSLPHVIEDFQYGALVRFGVTLPLGIAVLLIMYSLQLGALGLLLAGSSRPALVLAFTGAVWSIGAALIHGHDLIFAGENYRHGPVSKVLESSSSYLARSSASREFVSPIRDRRDIISKSRNVIDLQPWKR